MILSATAWTLVLGCIIVIHLALKRYLRKTGPHTLPLPPGPSGLPWIGNVIGININAPWLTYRDWARTHGDIVHSRLLGKDIIIINSEKMAKELFEKHSSNTSDRPYYITIELCGLGFNSVFLPYGDRWRLHRRVFHQTFRSDAIPMFLPFQHHKACQFLRRLLTTPTQLDAHVFEYTSSVILKSTYDYDPPSQDDELIKIVAKVQEIGLSVVRPEIAIMLATFPMLLKLPAWFPGMSFKTEMETARKLTRQYVEATFEYSLQRVRDCSTAPFMVHDALQIMETKGTASDESWMNGAKDAAATAFLAASETGHSVLLSFFLMMVLNPAAQEKAQAEIDAVVGKNRLPTMDDRPLLPFIDAIFRETLRHSPVVPLSVPHVASDDDEYRGFRIPKGAILFANLWSMAHDEARYPDPHAFLPERFLNADGSLKPNDTEHLAFGFGRRICVGRYFADASVWTVIASVLAVFKILKPLDEDGVEKPVEPKFTSGLGIRPVPFECRIVPRMTGMDCEKLEELIAASTA